jgi:hypothetical protein
MIVSYDGVSLRREVKMASDDGCEVAERTSGGAVKYTQPAVATVTDSIKSYRFCAAHARRMENTGGSHTVEWD